MNNNKNLCIIGLTGPIGSGKSTVAYQLQQQGYVWLEIDQLGHELLAVNSPIHAKIISIFNTDLRSEIRDQVFADAKKLEQLNLLTHPLILDMVKKQLETLGQKSGRTVVLDAAVLFEIGLDKVCDQIWAVWTSQELASERMASKGWDKATVRKAYDQQKTKEFFLENADVFIENIGSKNLVQKTVGKLITRP
jgi:dephospho-CoA kinase